MFDELFSINIKEKNDINLFSDIIDKKAGVIHIYGSINIGRKILYDIAKEKDNSSFLLLYSSYVDNNLPKLENMLVSATNKIEIICAMIDTIEKGYLDFLMLDNVMLLTCEDEANRTTSFPEGIRKLIDICNKKKIRLIFTNSINIKNNPYGISYQVNRVIDETIRCVNHNNEILLVNVKNNKKVVINRNEL